jgi:hypothetical protein
VSIAITLILDSPPIDSQVTDILYFNKSCAQYTVTTFQVVYPELPTACEKIVETLMEGDAKLSILFAVSKDKGTCGKSSDKVCYD